MAEPDQAQFYLITPPQFDLASFPDQLSRVLDVAGVACVRLSMASQDQTRISRAADVLREICHARDIALVIETHVLLVQPLGLDGVHLRDGARAVRKTRKILGPDAIIGSFCGVTRHDGLNAAEAGADYVSFGPLGKTPLGDGRRAGADLFAWWSEMIETPVVAEGALDAGLVGEIAPLSDFLAIGAEIWNTDAPAQAFARLVAARDQAAPAQAGRDQVGG